MMHHLHQLQLTCVKFKKIEQIDVPSLGEEIAAIYLKNNIDPIPIEGDIVEIFSPTKDIITTEITKIYDCDNNLIEVVRHPKQIVKIYVKDKLDAYDMIRVKRIDKDNKM